MTSEPPCSCPCCYAAQLELSVRSAGKLEALAEIARLKHLMQQLWRGAEEYLAASETAGKPR